MVTEQECIFCKIVRGEMPSKKVYEDNDIIAFLDINPANPGHCLVVPKKHSEAIYETDDEVLKKLITVTKKLATRIKEKMNADGINILQNNGRHAGQLVSHIHFHIIPRFPDDKVIITYQRVQADEALLNDIVKKLKDAGEKKSASWELDF